MKFLSSLGLVSCILLLLSSCKTDLQLNAPYKEMPSIYAVLDSSETVHMIRINKIFLGEGNANEMAQVADSVNYAAGELTVTMKHSGGHIFNFTDSVIQTVPGAFSSTQRVYVNHERLLSTGAYTLTVKNNHTGNVFTAKSNALAIPRIKDTYRPFVKIYYPVPAGSPVNDDNYIDYSGQGVVYSVKFNPDLSTIGPKIYQLLIRMHYYDSLGDGNKNYTFIDYAFNNQLSKDYSTIGGIKFINYQFKGSDLFSAAGVAMSKKSPVSLLKGRKMYKIQFFVFSSTQDYIDYLEYSKPSLNIAQTKPIYSNFDNQAAIGLFTFRNAVNVEKNMSTAFISEFARNKNTCQYQFYTSALGQPACP